MLALLGGRTQVASSALECVDKAELEPPGDADGLASRPKNRAIDSALLSARDGDGVSLLRGVMSRIEYATLICSNLCCRSGETSPGGRLTTCTSLSLMVLAFWGEAFSSDASFRFFLRDFFFVSALVACPASESSSEETCSSARFWGLGGGDATFVGWLGGVSVLAFQMSLTTLPVCEPRRCELLLRVRLLLALVAVPSPLSPALKVSTTVLGCAGLVLELLAPISNCALVFEWVNIAYSLSRWRPSRPEDESSSASGLQHLTKSYC